MRSRIHIRAFTLVEVLVSIVISAMLMVAATQAAFMFGQRMVADLQRDQTQKNANRLLIMFRGAMRTATDFAIYDSRSAFLDTGTEEFLKRRASGNFFVAWTPTETIGFENESGSVRLVRITAGPTIADTLVCNSQVQAYTENGTPVPFVRLQNGVPMISWSVALPAERVDFQVCAQPLWMQ